jgi:hypothetical protein
MSDRVSVWQGQGPEFKPQYCQNTHTHTHTHTHNNNNLPPQNPQYYTEILSHPIQNGYHREIKKQQMLVRILGEMSHYSLLMGM